MDHLPWTGLPRIRRELPGEEIPGQEQLF
jgi:hypothetical protein